MKRVRMEIAGIVQGVGFRPFLFRLATASGLTGWAMNTPSGVLLEVQGRGADIERFTHDVSEQAPPLAVIGAVRSEEMAPVCESGFTIRQSGGVGSEVHIAADYDVCPDCLAELFDPANRRYRYPFINCTNCGPRYTIIKTVPYDRSSTTMSGFIMCGDCQAEYDDPLNRRFHAQPNACPACGPALVLLDARGTMVESDPVDAAISLLKAGKILALKGLGGYHLAVDACNTKAVEELRRRKKRDEKPFALMSADLETVARYAVFDEAEAKLLSAPERPIVLVRKREGNAIAHPVSPSNGYFGVMLPYTPLHHLLLRENFTALVMTSGNLSDEPISYLDQEAFQRLNALTDFFLMHNREIHTRTDDSVLRVFRGNPIFLRRSRGYAPRAITIPEVVSNILAVGAELKGAVCLARGDKAFLSQHIGDLQNPATLRSMEYTVDHLERVLKVTPEVVAYDLHPDYLSTNYAFARSEPQKIAVQHHHAHMGSCMAENGLEGEVIGVIFDGTGYGCDGTIWGGEFLAGGYGGFDRKGHLRALPLPGGDAAVREPYRMALSYLHDCFGDEVFELTLSCLDMVSTSHRNLFLKMMTQTVNSPLTSSCGRLFDAVAALIGLRYIASYDGQAAMELEAEAEAVSSSAVFPYHIITADGKICVDFTAMIRSITTEVGSGRATGEIARVFHNTVAAAVADVCRAIRAETDLHRVVLSGGVFQNRLLSELVHSLLEADGFSVFTHRLAPPNDGGVALGQAVIAGRIAAAGG